ncbi:MAG: hypothetical protein J1F11_09985 [Oscillospiraceae bacterium]|nr:hypothetical protein [Oscillospiraceae bacterium]
MWLKSEKKPDIQNDLASLLPDEIKADEGKGYVLTDAWLTSFSLDTGYLYDILYSLYKPDTSNTLKLIEIENKRLHVFYDKYEKSTEDSIGMAELRGCLHPVGLVKTGGASHPGAFHPKVILLRYENKNDKKIRYVIFVMSRNLAHSNLMDAFSAAWGDVTDKPANGKKVSEFFENCAGKAGMRSFGTKIRKELETVNFMMNGQSVSFLTEKEVFNKIQNKENLIVISPFLAKEFIDNMNAELKLLVSTAYGFGSIHTDRNDSAPDKYILFKDKNDKLDLHAKIYCWKDPEQKTSSGTAAGEKAPRKAHWIVGSSNATGSGCGIGGSSGNIEFNMMFSTDADEYDDLYNYLNGLRRFNDAEDDMLISGAAKAFDARGYLYELLENINTDCCKNGDKYECKIKLIDENRYKNAGYKAMVKVSGSGDVFKDISSKCTVYCSEGSDNGGNAVLHRFEALVLQSYAPFSSIDIRIEDSNNQENSRSFCISIDDKWSDDVRKELESQSEEAFDKRMQSIQKNMLKGKKNPMKRAAQETSGTSQKNATSPYKMGKNYIFEEIMELSSRYKDDDKFCLELEKIKGVPRNSKEPDYKGFIDNFLKGR